MTTTLHVNDHFPDFELPDHQNKLRRIHTHSTARVGRRCPFEIVESRSGPTARNIQQLK